MHFQRAFLFTFFVIAVCSNASFARDLELKLGEVRESTLDAGQTQSFVLSLEGGDFVQIGVDPRGQALIVRTYDPAGKPFRGAAIGPESNRLNLVAEMPGDYRVEARAKDRRASGTFSIVLEKIVSLASRLAPPKPVVASPRIEAFRASIERGEPDAVQEFWKQIESSSAPLIEPIPGDRENMAVTFLWKGKPNTQSVLVLWLPYVGVTPDEFFMTRLPNTDVWYKTIKVKRKMRLAYTLAPNAARIPPISLGFDQDAITMAATAARPDPLNPKRFRIDPESVDAPEFRGNSVLEMPDASPQPWVSQRPGVSQGRIEPQRFKSTMLGNERDIAVYLPPNYSPTSKPYPLLLLFDKDAYLDLIPTPTTLDNLISDRRIPPVVALLIANPPGARDRELVCNPQFSQALAAEFLPWAHGLYNFTTDPGQTIIAGSSAGGLAATCSGLWHPEAFGNVLAQSGAFYRIPSNSVDSNSEPNWVARQFISSPKKQLRFYLDMGSAEFNATGGLDSTVFSTLALRDVLRAKGYEVYFQEFEGGHDYLSWRGTLADGLIALLGDAAPK